MSIKYYINVFSPSLERKTQLFLDVAQSLLKVTDCTLSTQEGEEAEGFCGAHEIF